MLVFKLNAALKRSEQFIFRPWLTVRSVTVCKYTSQLLLHHQRLVTIVLKYSASVRQTPGGCKIRHTEQNTKLPLTFSVALLAYFTCGMDIRWWFY